MNRFSNLKLKSLEQSGSILDYKPSLPERFQITGCVRWDEQLWLYDVFDRHAAEPARLWLEEIKTTLEEHRVRAVALQGLSHNNLWPVYDHFRRDEGEKHYYAIVAKAPGLQYVTSRTLLAGSINVIVVGQIFRQLALALNYCHSQNALHGHLQPMFIWVGRDGRVRLELFGALPGRPYALKVAGAGSFPDRLGSAAYTGPEQFGTNAPPNPRTDIYALGVITYEMLAGFNPFLATSDLACQLRHTYKAAPPLHEINPAVGLSLEAAIMAALIKNPAGRYRCVLDFLSRFEIGLANTLQTANRPVSFPTIEQLIENHKLIAQQAHSFPNQALPRPDGSPVNPGQSEIATIERQPLKQLSATGLTKPVPPILTEPVPVKPVPPSRPPGPAAKPGPRPIPAKATAAAQSTRLKWPVPVPWLLVLNLFLMGYLAWLLLNSTGSIDSTLSPPAITIPGRSLVIPSPSATQPPTPTVSQASSPLASPADFTETPAGSGSDFTPTPGNGPDLSNPHVLTALAPTATPGPGFLSGPEATTSLTPEDLTTPTETPAALINPGQSPPDTRLP